MKLELSLGRIALRRSAAALLACGPAFAQSSPRRRQLGAGRVGGQGRPVPRRRLQGARGHGFKCMGFKPAVKLLAAGVVVQGRLGRTARAAEEAARRLRRGAEVQEGHGPAGRRRPAMPTPRARPKPTCTLSIKRAEAVKEYLVQMGADPSMLTIAGLGSNDPKNRQPVRAGEPPRRDRPLTRSVRSEQRPGLRPFPLAPARRVGSGNLLGRLAGDVDLMTPAHMHISLEVSFSAGGSASSTVGAPGTQGAGGVRNAGHRRQHARAPPPWPRRPSGWPGSCTCRTA